MRKPQQGSGQRAYLDPDNLYRMLGFDPEKERERRRFREEIRHLRQTRRTAIAALIVSSLTAIGTVATAIIMALD
jgi:hypothetical protein